MSFPKAISYPWVEEVPSTWPFELCPYGPDKGLVTALEYLAGESNDRALQLGAGPTGLWLAILGFKTTMIDIDPEVVMFLRQHARELGSDAEITTCDARKFRTGEEFQLISTDIPVYLKRSEMLTVTKQCKNWVGAGGVLHLEFKTPNDSSYQEALTMGSPEIEPGSFRHTCPCGCGFEIMSFWTPAEVYALFEDDKRFDIVYFDTHEWFEAGYYSLGSGHFWSFCQISVIKH